MDSPLFVLAGGFGTRLKSVVSDCPKPLAPVGDLPFLQYLIDGWVEAGFQRFIFLLHHQAGQIVDFLKSLEKSSLANCFYSSVIEDRPLGTGGAIANAVRELDIKGDIIISNADTWIKGSGREMLTSSSPSMAVVEVENTGRYGTVCFDECNLVTDFNEKREVSGPGWINAGMYKMQAEYFSHWEGEPFSLERDSFPKLVEKRFLRVVLLNSEFIDIGIPEDYQRFIRWVSQGKVL